MKFGYFNPSSGIREGFNWKSSNLGEGADLQINGLNMVSIDKLKKKTET